LKQNLILSAENFLTVLVFRWNFQTSLRIWACDGRALRPPVRALLVSLKI